MYKKAAILITTIIILTFLSILAMGLAAFLFSRQLSGATQLERLQALYLSEAGIAQSIHELKLDKDLDGTGKGNIAPTRLGSGTYQAKHDFRATTITATGKVGDVTRTVQIKYRAL
jgi:type II secretory pathway component PulK